MPTLAAVNAQCYSTDYTELYIKYIPQSLFKTHHTSH